MNDLSGETNQTIELPDEEVEAPGAGRRSSGGLYIGVGFGFLLLESLASFSLSGDHWPMLAPAFLFALYGFLRAEGWGRRVSGVLVCGCSGGWLVSDLLTFVASR